MVILGWLLLAALILWVVIICGWEKFREWCEGQHEPGFWEEINNKED